MVILGPRLGKNSHIFPFFVVANVPQSVRRPSSITLLDFASLTSPHKASRRHCGGRHGGRHGDRHGGAHSGRHDGGQGGRHGGLL